MPHNGPELCSIFLGMPERPLDLRPMIGRGHDVSAPMIQKDRSLMCKAIHLRSADWPLEASSCPSQNCWHGGMLTEAQGLGSRADFFCFFIFGPSRNKVTQNSYSGRAIHREPPCVTQGAGSPGLVPT